MPTESIKSILMRRDVLVAMENENLVEALKNKDNEKVIELLDSEF